MILRRALISFAALGTAAIFVSSAGAQTSMPESRTNILDYPNYYYNPGLDPRRDTASATTYAAAPQAGTYQAGVSQAQAPAPVTNPSAAVPAAGLSNTSGDLPGYTYNRNYDTKIQPPIGYPTRQMSSDGSPPPTPPYMSLATRTGFEPSIQIYDYRYREPGLGVTLDGAKFGADAKGTINFRNLFFASADLRYAVGWLDYQGSGSSSDNPDETAELRGVIGKDFLFTQWSLSPYAGIGYRHEYSDSRGSTTTGAGGYQRTNQTYYIPIGISPRTHIDTNSRLTFNLEYDLFLHGTQESDLSDVGGGDPNLKNQQHHGYGMRGEIMYETRTWSIGPFFNYWNIDQSDPQVFFSPGSTCGATTCVGVEPNNHTLEAGVQARYHFF
jgi:hypothetical protein